MENTNRRGQIRGFIALELSGQAREELSVIERELKQTGADVKWVKPGSIHITLKFLGNIDPGRIPDIEKILRETFAGISSFDIVLGSIGVFPDWPHARVLWVGLSQGASELEMLASSVESVMEKEGFAKEARPFSSHITIGRVKSPKNKNELEKLACSIKVTSVAVHISRVVLFKSVLTPRGAEYSPLAIVDLS
ncbi:MAG: RNA 2',3'-cyclic phosphodiesterase [Candidatus Omnitrophota bacterium]